MTIRAFRSRTWISDAVSNNKMNTVLTLYVNLLVFIIYDAH